MDFDLIFNILVMVSIIAASSLGFLLMFISIKDFIHQRKIKKIENQLIVAVKTMENRGVRLKKRQSGLSSDAKANIDSLYKDGMAVLRISRILNIPRTSVRRHLGKIV